MYELSHVCLDFSELVDVLAISFTANYYSQVESSYVGDG